jgi:N utilization substance protein A
MNDEIMLALGYLEREKGIQRETLIQAVEAALASAARKAMHLKKEDVISARLDTATGKIRFFLDDKEIDSAPFGRIAAQTAKQVIIQKIREAERGLIFSEFEAKKGEIVNGLVHRLDKGNLIIDLGKTEGIIFRPEQSRREEFRQGDRIKAYCIDVRKSSQGPQVILSRAHPNFVKKLFENEVPEVYEKIVEIKAISREAGERTKIAVSSSDEKIDSVGACVGVRGARVKNVVKELHGEKIDIIRWSEDLSEFTKAALAPAELEEVNVDSGVKKIQVIVNEDQLSLAIGKKGQNVRLACKLLGWDIDIRTRIQLAAQKKVTIRDIKGVGPKLAKALEQAGFTDLGKIASSAVEDLTRIEGIGKKSAEKIIAGAKVLLGKE